jgi:X box-binding protein 1
MKGTPGRKRKLDHLSIEEKVQRKKLKNRVAAQTSRDRKKKLVEEMEKKLDQQQRQINALQKRCEQITNERDRINNKYEKLEREFQKLKNGAGTYHHNIPEEHRYTRILSPSEVDHIVGSISIKPEPAVFNEYAPLPKVNQMEKESTVKSTQMTSKKMSSDVQTLMKIILLCLLYKNSSQTLSSTSSTLNSLQKVCSKMSPQTWKRLINKAALQMPKVKANNSNCLNHWWGPETKEWNPPKIAV